VICRTNIENNNARMGFNLLNKQYPNYLKEQSQQTGLRTVLYTNSNK